MPNESKEQIIAERQDNYKQEKEEIFKKALEEYKEESSGETSKNDENNI